MLTILVLQLSLMQLQNDCFINRGLAKSPSNPIQVVELPSAIDKEGGVFLPNEKAIDVIKRLKCLNAWPQACQITLNALIVAKESENQARIEQINELTRIAKEPKLLIGLPTWAIISISVGAFVVGGFAGYGLANIN